MRRGHRIVPPSEKWRKKKLQVSWYRVKKALLEKQLRRCADCRREVKLRLTRIKKTSELLRESDYILLCRECIAKRHEEKKLEGETEFWE